MEGIVLFGVLKYFIFFWNWILSWWRHSYGFCFCFFGMHSSGVTLALVSPVNTEIVSPVNIESTDISVLSLSTTITSCAGASD